MESTYNVYIYIYTWNMIYQQPKKNILTRPRPHLAFQLGAAENLVRHGLLEHQMWHGGITIWLFNIAMV